MTDRELLEAAARAAGIENHPATGFLKPNGVYWNPLTDDGDALRLAIQLKTVWSFRQTFVVIEDSTSTIGEALGYDPAAATRRAVVRAAAAIGEKM